MATAEHIVYSLQTPLGPIRYIGRTCSPKARLRSHIHEARHGNPSAKSRWIRELLAKGEEPQLIVLERTPSVDEAIRLEREWRERLAPAGDLLKGHRVGGGGIIGRIRLSPQERASQKIDKHGPFAVIHGKRSRCWLWIGSKNKRGYGSFYIGPGSSEASGRVVIHRWLWEQEHGPIPLGMTVHHLCHTPSCVRISHFELLPWSEHSRLSRRELKTHCIRGHSLADAYVNPRGQRHCRICARPQYRAYQERNKEALAEKARERQIRRRTAPETREEELAYHREWMKQWRHDHPEEARAIVRKSHAKHKDLYNQNRREKYAQKKLEQA